MTHRGGPPRHIADALPFDGTPAGALARARQNHPPAPAPPPDRPPEPPEPPANSPEDAGHAPAEPHETALERFEVLAEEFRRDTGMLAPGKDYPVGAHPPPDRERSDRWETWLRERRRAAAAKAAELARAAQPKPGEDGPARGDAPSRCKSCDAPILWAQVLDAERREVLRKPDGKLRVMPVDFEPNAEKGNVVCLRRGRTIVCFTLRRGETPPLGARLRTGHHMTCPEAQQWKKTKKGRGMRR